MLPVMSKISPTFDLLLGFHQLPESKKRQSPGLRIFKQFNELDVQKELELAVKVPESLLLLKLLLIDKTGMKLLNFR